MTQIDEQDDTSDEAAPEPAETSLDELASKTVEADGDEDVALAGGREERVEGLSVKVVPQQPTEFTCKKCFLVKHQSQLADKKRMFCRDCA